MTVEADIRTALNVRLNSLAGGNPISWENTTYEPALGTTYLRPTVLPSETVGATMSATGTDEHSGIYQVDIFSEAGIGHGLAMALADSVADHFKPSTKLTYNSRVVRCVSVSVMQGRPDKGWYIIPVEIRYLAFTAKR